MSQSPDFKEGNSCNENHEASPASKQSAAGELFLLTLDSVWDAFHGRPPQL